VIFLDNVLSIIHFDFSSRSSIKAVYLFGLLNSLHIIIGVFFCNIAVIYQTLFFCVYGFLIKVHQITMVFPLNNLVFGFVLQYRDANFNHHLNCDFFICSCVIGIYFHSFPVVPEDIANSGIFPGYEIFFSHLSIYSIRGLNSLYVNIGTYF
jgi:hypothetical protein